jgi:formate dehydrogenase gamma subunit
MKKRSPDEVLRFTVAERVQHLMMMISMIVLALTGLSLRFHQTFWGSWLIRLEGGLAGRGWIHRAAAVVLIGVAVYHHFYVLLSPRGHRLLQDYLPRSGDLGRFLQGFRFSMGWRESRPDWGKFNLFQKLQYLGVVVGVTTMILTGFVLWLGPPVIALIPKWLLDLTLIVHGGEGLLIFILLFFWHMYNVHLSPGNFPMNWSWITGRISRTKCQEDHPAEFRRLLAEGELSE